MSVRPVSAAAALAACLALRAPGALAQQPPPPDDAAGEAASASARAHYNAGTKAYADKRFVEAALSFEAAAADKSSPVALYTAALCWELANVPDRAADDFARALATPGLPADKTTQAQVRLASLEGVLGAVSVVGPEGSRVQLDANSEQAVPATMHGTGGVHTLSARAPGRPVQRRSVVLERGKTTKVDLVAEPAPPGPEDARKEPAPPAPPVLAAPPPRATDWKRPVGLVALGAGATLLLSGVVLGSEAIGARDAYRGAPSQGGFDHASELQMWTNVAFVAGGVLAAGGVALVVWPSPKAGPDAAPQAVRLAPAPGGLVLGGAF
jgi:hypothetical protein